MCAFAYALIFVLDKAFLPPPHSCEHPLWKILPSFSLILVTRRHDDNDNEDDDDNHTKEDQKKLFSVFYIEVERFNCTYVNVSSNH